MPTQEPFRITEQRKIILEELQKLHSHPTADELYAIVRKKLPSISLATVYRNLEILSESGMIQKLRLAGAAKRFDAEMRPHYHIRCKKCGSVSDIPLEPLDIINNAARRATDYEVLSHRLEYIGICPRCKNRGE